jgi:hypothetical protein
MAALVALSMVACHKAQPPDAVCSYEALPATVQVPSGQGAIETLASTDAYFSVRDRDSKQIASTHVNGITPLPAGDYEINLNGSVHKTSAQPRMLTKCSSGVVVVNGKTDEYYAVLDAANRQLASAHLGSPLSLFPGSYKVRVNNVEIAANVQAGAAQELKSGTVNVEAGTDEYFAILDAANQQLASSHLGRAVSLFPGHYAVRINSTEGRVDVRSGEDARVAAGMLVVRGSTDEYYAVTSNAGVQLASAHLDRPLGLIPGTYNIKLNNSSAPVNVVAGATTEVKSGAVVFQGSTDEYYSIIDSAGTQLASAHLGRALSFVPGAYRAKLNNVAIAVTVDSGQIGQYQSGTLGVKTTGSGYYAVLDASGTQLASQQISQSISLPAGKYSIKFGNDTRPATVIAGQNVILNW